VGGDSPLNEFAALFVMLHAYFIMSNGSGTTYRLVSFRILQYKAVRKVGIKGLEHIIGGWPLPISLELACQKVLETTKSFVDAS